jgi:hypothetical protein
LTEQSLASIQSATNEVAANSAFHKIEQDVTVATYTINGTLPGVSRWLQFTGGAAGGRLRRISGVTSCFLGLLLLLCQCFGDRFSITIWPQIKEQEIDALYDDVEEKWL